MMDAKLKKRDLVSLEFARKLSSISLDDFQKFCIGAPRELFTENIVSSRTLVSWLDDNIEVLRYAIVDHNANVNTTASGYDVDFDKSRRFHTSLNMITYDDIFELIVTSDTLDISPIEFSNMVHRYNMNYGVLFWDIKRDVSTNVLRILEIMISRSPNFLFNCINSVHNLSKTFVDFVFDNLQGQTDEKFKTALSLQYYNRAIEYIPMVSLNTIRDYQVYDRLLRNRYVFGATADKKLSDLWQCIGARLGSNLVLSNGENLIVLIYKRFVVVKDHFGIDCVSNALTHMLPGLIIDWSPLNEYIADGIKTKQYDATTHNYVALFIMKQNGFVNFPSDYLFACIQSVLYAEVISPYRMNKNTILTAINGLIATLGMDSTTLELINETIPHQSYGNDIVEYNGYYYTDLVLLTIPNDSFEKFPEQINAIVEKLRASATSSTHEQFYARICNYAFGKKFFPNV